MLCNEHNNMNLTTGTTGIQDCRGRWILSCLFEQEFVSRLVLNYTLVQFHWSSLSKESFSITIHILIIHVSYCNV